MTKENFTLFVLGMVLITNLLIAYILIALVQRPTDIVYNKYEMPAIKKGEIR